MKVLKKFTALLMVVVLGASLLLLAACPGPEKADPESRPLTMSLQNPDGVFNPFFSTSAMDSTVIGMTQISMLSSTPKGEPLCGDNEPVVVKSYTVETAPDKSYTDYTFVIKNGIKFSDGTPLTIKDVLFNLYIYLDPVYTGSATLYSTDIVGLQQYRQQDDNASDDSTAFEERFVARARQRMDKLVEFVQAFGRYTPPVGQPDPDKSKFTAEDIKNYSADFAYVATEFRKELETDWNNADAESYKDEGFGQGIDGKWQVFLMNDAQVDFYKKDAAGEKYLKDEKGNKIFDPDIATELEGELNTWLSDNKLTKNDDNVRQWAIDYAYAAYFPTAVLSGPYNPDVFKEDQLQNTIAATSAKSFALILSSWMTSTTVLTQFTADAKSAQLGGDDHPVKTISGITSSLDDDVDQVMVDGVAHDVLKIRINDIDPKAIWNFSFTVAPMHYYSGTWQGVDYVKTFNAKEGRFGFKFSDKDFFDKVLNAPEKVGLPMGAGVYKASTSRGGVAKNGGEFMDSNIIYFERNEHFYTVFGNDTSKNAKIKYFRYKVVETDQIINSIIHGDIDIGDPNATPKNIQWLDNEKIAHEEVMTSGYGYVGINPRFVPDVHVRRAIIKAMNAQMIKENYYQNLCDIIYRPMSKASWAYPDADVEYYTTYTDKNGDTQTVTYKYDKSGNEIDKLLQSVGYTKGSDGIYHRVLANGSDHKLSYKFTIAGSSTDHPAYSMFVEAAALLNKHGFDIKVVTSQSALSDLSAGKLAVWAAAWSSTIDPDMYQVYHKDSNASSVNNWGYPQIKADKKLYSFESQLIEELSELIDNGRKTDVQSTRETIYRSALNKVMEFAVEFPTYQRRDMTAYNDKLLDRNTMTPTADVTPYNGLLSRIWELNYIQ